MTTHAFTTEAQPCREAVAYTGYRDGVRRSCDTHHGPWPCPVTAWVCTVAGSASEWTAVIDAVAAVADADAAAAAARERRDRLVAALVAAGVSMYRVSKVLDVSESGVRKMVARAQNPNADALGGR